MTSTALDPGISASGEQFDDFVAAMQRHVASTLALRGTALVRVDTPHLASLYLASLPEALRQHHTCFACTAFIGRYGNLAVIDETGALQPLVWPATAPALYQPATTALARAVQRGTVAGVAQLPELVWGRPVTGPWTHLAVCPPAASSQSLLGDTAYQIEAAKAEDFRTLRHGLGEFSPATVAQAVTLLDTEALYRAEKVRGPARFLHELHTQLAGVRGQRRDNLIWRAVCTAPPGFCQPRSTMVGTLLADLAAGLDFATVQQRFTAKMHPLQYQRPQAAPAAGTIAQAEKLVEQSNIAPSLRRRFARLDEIETVWRPAVVPDTAPPEGVFGHLQPKGRAAVEASLLLPVQSVTWEKFARTVLPQATSIEAYVNGPMDFCALVTAADVDAPPILQWDRAERRNPFSWYVYNHGSLPEQWGLTSHTWVPVTAVALQPSMWHEATIEHQGTGAIFVLAGARDSRESGLSLFPEMLQAALHPVRAVIEAYSHSRQLEGREAASANGLRVGRSTGGLPNRFRVTTSTGVVPYHIDRWD